MRMWMIETKLLCTKHLLGEHGEIHKHRHGFVKHHSIDGRMSPIVQIEPQSMKSRHDELAAEITRRGGNHKSPYEQPDISYLPEWQQTATVDIEYNIADLCARCEDCRDRISGLLLQEQAYEETKEV